MFEILQRSPHGYRYGETAYLTKLCLHIHTQKK